ncbi:unnamed protein product, partial [Discosporangium mesarthrocarpum]
QLYFLPGPPARTSCVALFVESNNHISEVVGRITATVEQENRHCTTDTMEADIARRLRKYGSLLLLWATSSSVAFIPSSYFCGAAGPLQSWRPCRVPSPSAVGCPCRDFAAADNWRGAGLIAGNKRRLSRGGNARGIMSMKRDGGRERKRRRGGNRDGGGEGQR